LNYSPPLTRPEEPNIRPVRRSLSKM
jgi:hypothetical protein